MFIKTFPIEFEMEQRMILSSFDHYVWFNDRFVRNYTIYRPVGYITIAGDNELMATGLEYEGKRYARIVRRPGNEFVLILPNCQSTNFWAGTFIELSKAGWCHVRKLSPVIFNFEIYS